MFKKAFFFLISLSWFLSGCEEDPLTTRNSAPKVAFAFYADGEAIKPDSVYSSFGRLIFEDSTATYKISLPVSGKRAEMKFFVDSLNSEVILQYEWDILQDVDRIIYDLHTPAVMATNVDSLTILCNDTINCSTDEAIINLYF